MGNCSTCCGNENQEIHIDKENLMEKKTQNMAGVTAGRYSTGKFDVNNLDINNEKLSNPNVNELLIRLGPFEYENLPPLDQHEQVEKRGMVELENGAKYEGEWIVDSETRQGLGV